jgi:peptidoglycan-associated lipoprotein
MSRTARLVLASLAALSMLAAVSGCRSAKPKTQKPPAVPSDTDSSRPTGETEVPTTKVTPADDVIKDDHEQDQVPNAEAVQKRLRDAFFDFDSSDLRADAREALSASADALKANTAVRITVEGHCDERGTREYNVSLGERRAAAAKEYLVSLGIAEDRITVISYGKEKPFNPGHDESAWQENRRAHLVVTGR